MNGTPSIITSKETGEATKNKVDTLQKSKTNKVENHEEKVQLQSGSSTTEREGRHESRPNESLGKSEQHKTEGSIRRGMDRRDRENPVSDNIGGASVSQLSKSKSSVKGESNTSSKNSRNKVSELGVDYAPKGENVRIEANLKAIESKP